MLFLQVHCTGLNKILSGICKENIPLIFNRYSVLDNIQENSIKGLSSRNGLGLAICQSMVELLQGTIEVKSEIDQYAQFIVNLPQLEVTEEAEHVLNETPKSEPLSNNTNIETAERGDYEKEFNQPETTILMIDDNKELLWMLKGFYRKYGKACPSDSRLGYNGNCLYSFIRSLSGRSGGTYGIDQE